MNFIHFILLFWTAIIAALIHAILTRTIVFL